MEICFPTKCWTVELSAGIFLLFSFPFFFFCSIVIQLESVCIFSLTLFSKLYTKSLHSLFKYFFFLSLIKLLFCLIKNNLINFNWKHWMDSSKLTLINQTSLFLTDITYKNSLYYCLFSNVLWGDTKPLGNFEVGHLIDSAVLNITSILNKNRKIAMGQFSVCKQGFLPWYDDKGLAWIVLRRAIRQRKMCVFNAILYNYWKRLCSVNPVKPLQQLLTRPGLPKK